MQVLKEFLESMPEEERRIDLFIVTHIDADHIEGAIVAAEDPLLSKAIRSVMFNGGHHLQEASDAVAMSPAQGDALTKLIVDNGWTWNAQFGGKAVHNQIATNPVTLCESPRVRAWILGPSIEGLFNLARIWPVPAPRRKIDGSAMAMGEEPLDVEALASSKYRRDRAVQNGSSIALVVEHDDKMILLTADSHAETLVESIGRLFDGKLPVDIATVPHHGSKHNTSPKLAEMVVAPIWTISTEGDARNEFPNGESIARLITARSLERPLRIVFNSQHKQAAAWNDDRAKRRYGYTTLYPDPNEDWITLELIQE